MKLPTLGYDMEEEEDDNGGYDQGPGLGSGFDTRNHKRNGSGGGNVFALTAGFSMSGSEADNDEDEVIESTLLSPPSPPDHSLPLDTHSSPLNTHSSPLHHTLLSMTTLVSLYSLSNHILC